MATAAGDPGGARRTPGDQPLWLEVPSWFAFGEEDRTIPATLQHFVAERAGARHAVEVLGASHAIAVSQPDLIAQLILQGRGAARCRLTHPSP